MTKPRYLPRYAKGQILVFFHYGDENFARTFGEALGYKMLDEYDAASSTFVYQTKPGKEQAAIDEFKSYLKVVEGAERYDTRLEERYKNLEYAERILGEVLDVVELDRRTLNKKLESVRKLIRRIKEK